MKSNNEVLKIISQLPRGDEVRKPVLVKLKLHRRLKVVAFNNEIKLQDLMDAIIQTVLKNQNMLNEVVSKIKLKNF